MHEIYVRMDIYVYFQLLVSNTINRKNISRCQPVLWSHHPRTFKLASCPTLTRVPLTTIVWPNRSLCKMSRSWRWRARCSARGVLWMIVHLSIPNRLHVNTRVSELYKVKHVRTCWRITHTDDNQEKRQKPKSKTSQFSDSSVLFAVPLYWLFGPVVGGCWTGDVMLFYTIPKTRNAGGYNELILLKLS